MLKGPPEVKACLDQWDKDSDFCIRVDECFESKQGSFDQCTKKLLDQIYAAEESCIKSSKDSDEEYKKLYCEWEAYCQVIDNDTEDACAEDWYAYWGM